MRSQLLPRDGVVPSDLAPSAYEDTPPSHRLWPDDQPALYRRPHDRSGSGYQAAVLAELAGEIYTIERIPELAEMAQENLRRQGYSRVTCKAGDGAPGWPEQAPFDAILVTAVASEAAEALKAQLNIGGRLIIPVGPLDFFVPLI